MNFSGGEGDLLELQSTRNHSSLESDEVHMSRFPADVPQMALQTFLIRLEQDRERDLDMDD